jgi:hypothetical protein
MKKKLYLMFAFVIALSLLLAPAALAQEDEGTTTAAAEEDLDLVRVEIRNHSDQPVFIVLTTNFLPQGEQPAEGPALAGASPFSGPVSTVAIRMAEDVGTESGVTRFWGLAVGPDSEQTFTVERGVYFHRTTACGETRDGVVDLTSQIRLVFVPCEAVPENEGAPSQEKVSLSEDSPSGVNWRYQFQ